ncbi:GntR family transcriptional regulator [Micromonospora chalcea]|uniref:GntR family transcriptional regulator n=1 Tax=Micromonospora chalcea TaxID=1874 RepID=UPI00340E17A4
MPTPNYGQPRYRVIADELRNRLESGLMPPAALLPTESALSAEFKASRGTIRQAIEVLRREGLVATEHGRGSYANPTYYEAREPETRRRQVAADSELAALFAVEVGRALIEQEEIIRKNGAVEKVVRTYSLLRAQQ